MSIHSLWFWDISKIFLSSLWSQKHLGYDDSIEIQYEVMPSFNLQEDYDLYRV
jgi:hypothetical protein